jgi:hypothetical protein
MDLKKVLKHIAGELTCLDIVIERLMLFGSFARWQAHAHSNVGNASWSPQFTGLGVVDLLMYQPIPGKYTFLEIKNAPPSTGTYRFPFWGSNETGKKAKNSYKISTSCRTPEHLCLGDSLPQFEVGMAIKNQSLRK